MVFCIIFNSIPVLYTLWLDTILFGVQKQDIQR